jgi:hypothetical protein
MFQISGGVYMKLTLITIRVYVHAFCNHYLNVATDILLFATVK